MREMLLDGHAYHRSESELLKQANSHDFAILCFPKPHSSEFSATEPSFFKALKTSFNREAILWMRNHKERNITWWEVIQIIGKARYHMEALDFN
jgi:hypothetical protein